MKNIFKQIPNLLTMSRIAIIPFVIAIMYFEQSVLGHRIAAILFLYACATDFLDGFLARLLNARSRLGVALDPIADKILVVSVLIILVHNKKVDLLPTIAIACREMLVSGLREFLAKLRVSVPVSSLAKLKTFIQMGSIFILILGNEGSGIYLTNYIGRVALWIAAILTLITGYAYLKASYKHFIETKKATQIN